jgi:hypothetical protein
MISSYDILEINIGIPENVVWRPEIKSDQLLSSVDDTSGSSRTLNRTSGLDAEYAGF